MCVSIGVFACVVFVCLCVVCPWADMHIVSIQEPLVSASQSCFQSSFLRGCVGICMSNDLRSRSLLVKCRSNIMFVGIPTLAHQKRTRRLAICLEGTDREVAPNRAQCDIDNPQCCAQQWWKYVRTHLLLLSTPELNLGSDMYFSLHVAKAYFMYLVYFS